MDEKDNIYLKEDCYLGWRIYGRLSGKLKFAEMDGWECWAAAAALLVQDWALLKILHYQPPKKSCRKSESSSIACASPFWKPWHLFNSCMSLPNDLDGDTILWLGKLPFGGSTNIFIVALTTDTSWMSILPMVWMITSGKSKSTLVTIPSGMSLSQLATKARSAFKQKIWRQTKELQALLTISANVAKSSRRPHVRRLIEKLKHRMRFGLRCESTLELFSSQEREAGDQILMTENLNWRLMRVTLLYRCNLMVEQRR